MTSITGLLKEFDAHLLFTDTDSLTYEIKSKDFYEEFFKHKHVFDFSNYLIDLNVLIRQIKRLLLKLMMSQKEK